MRPSGPIQCRSLVLREFVLEDVAKVYKMSLESGMRQWIPDQVYESDEQAREVLDYLIAQYSTLQSPKDGPWVFGICLANTNELIGHVGLSPLPGQVEIGYAIEESQQGRGYATEAVAAMSQWGLETFGLETILGIVASGNGASCRVLEKAGFTLAKEELGTMHGRMGLIRTYARGAQR